MLEWAHTHGVTLRLIEPGKPNQNAYIESFNSRFRDECLNEHWFLNLRHARRLIERWRREYNEERPKKVPGGLPPPPNTHNSQREIKYSNSQALGQDATQEGGDDAFTELTAQQSLPRGLFTVL